MDKVKIAILIPCYNEGITIGKVVRGFKQELPSAEIYVYDNNSSDDTAYEATKAGAIVKQEPHKGKGNVIRTMFKDVDADIYVMVDGDDTYSAKDVHKLVENVKYKKADMVVGDRLSSTYYTENKRPFHNAGNKLVNTLINVIYGAKIKDVMTGYRAFSRKFVKSMPIMSNGFEIETEMTVFALNYGLNIEQVTIHYQDRPKGSYSKLNTFKDGFKVIALIIKTTIHNKLNYILGLMGALAIVLGIFVSKEFYAVAIINFLLALVVCKMNHMQQFVYKLNEK